MSTKNNSVNHPFRLQTHLIACLVSSLICHIGVQADSYIPPEEGIIAAPCHIPQHPFFKRFPSQIANQLTANLENSSNPASHPIRTIVFLGRDTPLLTTEQLADVKGVEIIDLKLPGSKKKFLKQFFLLLKEQDLTTAETQEIQNRVKNFYAENDHPFVVVLIPEQDITDGALQVRVIESHVGEVIVTGNEWFSTKRLKKFFGLKKGEEIDLSVLQKNMYFINQDPYLMGDVIFAPGTQLYTTDVTLAVQERNSIRLYAGVDNTGIENVGRNRWFFGANWGNLFNLGHILSYQYTASYNRKQFQGLTVQYIAPLTCHNTLNIYGGYSEVTPHLSVPSTRNHGWSMQASLRYEIPLTIYKFLEHTISVGGDFKRTNNTFDFTDNSPRIGQNVNLTQLVLDYNGKYQGKTYRLSFDASIFWSPGSFLGDQSNNDFQSLRRGAKHKWVYFKAGFSYWQNLPGRWGFYLLSRGQIASQNLLPSEQYGIGGYDTVRGYEERQLNKDSAFLTTIEFHSPRLPLINNACKSCNDKIEFLGFVDYGWGTDHTPAVPGYKTGYLLGAGPGIRYFYGSYLTARLDLGFKLHKQTVYGGGWAMVHFSVIGSY